MGTTETQISSPGRIASLDALTRPVDTAAVAQLKADATLDVRNRIARQTVDAGASTFILVFLFVAAATALAGLPFALAASFAPYSLLYVMFSLLGVAALAILSVTLGVWSYKRIRRIWMKRGTWTHRWRMRELATENRLNYIPTSGDLGRTGTILSTAGRGHWDTFRVLGERFSMFGNVLPFGRAAEDRAPQGWGFLALHLDAHVPRMLLMPRDPKISLRAPLVSVAGSQRVNLDGEFDRQFQLFVPTTYSRDALQIITPDLMTLLIERLPGSYVETFDNTLVVTTPDPFDFGRSEAWEQINLLLDTAVPKALRPTRN